MHDDQLEDHGLPLVQLKEQRRDLVVAFRGLTSPPSNQQIAEIAAIQQTIAAVEAVIVDLDAELETVLKERKRRHKSCGVTWCSWKAITAPLVAEAMPQQIATVAGGEALYRP